MAKSGPSLSSLFRAIAKAQDEGLDGDLVCIVHPRTWSAIFKELEGPPLVELSYSPGYQSIKIVADGCSMEIVPRRACERDNAYIMRKDDAVRALDLSTVLTA